MYKKSKFYNLVKARLIKSILSSAIPVLDNSSILSNFYG